MGNLGKSKNKYAISDFITQAYVIHRTGMVILSRKYAEACMKSDPQLIGGLIAAIITVTSATSPDIKCKGADDGKHRLLDFSTSCSRWFIHQQEDFVVSVLIPNNSKLINKPEIIENISRQILDTYLLYHQFKIDTEEKVDNGNEEQKEIGNTVDNFVSDVIQEITGEKLDFSKEGTIDHYELSVDSI